MSTNQDNRLAIAEIELANMHEALAAQRSMRLSREFMNADTASLSEERKEQPSKKSTYSKPAPPPIRTIEKPKADIKPDEKPEEEPVNDSEKPAKAKPQQKHEADADNGLAQTTCISMSTEEARAYEASIKETPAEYLANVKQHALAAKDSYQTLIKDPHNTEKQADFREKFRQLHDAANAPHRQRTLTKSEAQYMMGVEGPAKSLLDDINKMDNPAANHNSTIMMEKTDTTESWLPKGAIESYLDRASNPPTRHASADREPLQSRTSTLASDRTQHGTATSTDATCHQL